jgi:hypothetical protein
MPPREDETDWASLFWYLIPAIRCQCGAWIDLPYFHLPLSDETGLTLPEGEDPPQLPLEGWSATFGCRECGRVAGYTAQDVKVVPIPKAREGKHQSGKGVYFAKFPCGDRRCPVLASMYVNIGDGNASEVLDLLRSAHFQWILPCGHEMKTVPERYYEIVPVTRPLW